MQRLDLAGQRFGMLTVRAYAGTTKSAHASWANWACRCECGKDCVVGARHLLSWRTRSCGCWKNRLASERRFKHGHANIGGVRSREYRAWSAAKNRCTNPKNNRYATYGARGIRMCDEWASSFEAFLRDMGPCPEGYEIDRRDNDQHYEPGNCRWIPSERQASNRTTTRRVDMADGSSMTVAELCKFMGVEPHNVYGRLDQGWTVGRAIAAPVNTKRAQAAA